MSFLGDSELLSNIQALTNLGKRISGSNHIQIHFTRNNVPPQTDSRFIYLPEKFKRDLEGAQGLVAHEGGHIGYGSFELGFTKLMEILHQKYKLSLPFIKNIMNIMEDARINLINKSKYPGFYVFLRDLTLKEIPRLRKTLRENQDILIHIHLFLEDFEEFNIKPEGTSIKLTDNDWKEIQIIKKLLYKSLTPSTSILCIDQLCKILKKYIKEDQTPPNTSNRQNSRENRRRNNSYGYPNPGNPHRPTPHPNRYPPKQKHNSSHLNYDQMFVSNPYLKGGNILKASSEKLLNKIKNVDIKSQDLEKIYKDLQEKNEEDEKTDLKQEKNGVNSDPVNSIFEILKEADRAMYKRFINLEKRQKFMKLTKGRGGRKTFETDIKNEAMRSIDLKYATIKSQYIGNIKRMKLIFRDLKNEQGYDTFQTKGRINSKFIKAVTSDFKFNRCFTRKLLKKDLKLVILVDISGSMQGEKLAVAKIALVMLCEALESIADLRIVLFCGEFNARNILVKNFNELVDQKRFDKFGCHTKDNSNLDGISIQTEARNLKGNEIIIVISDGQPAGSAGYGLFNAIPEIYEVRKKFKVFAFSIDANGQYLDKLYGKNWILASSRSRVDLAKKMLQFCNLIIREFF